MKVLKIVTKDNFGSALFKEKVIAENVNVVIGQQMVKEWNEKYWTEQSDFYLELVADDYVLYDGYSELL